MGQLFFLVLDHSWEIGQSWSTSSLLCFCFCFCFFFFLTDSGKHGCILRERILNTIEVFLEYWPIGYSSSTPYVLNIYLGELNFFLHEEDRVGLMILNLTGILFYPSLKSFILKMATNLKMTSLRDSNYYVKKLSCFFSNFCENCQIFLMVFKAFHDLVH